MSSPRLNRKLVLEAPERVSDGAGGFSEAWVPLGVLWAEIAARTGRAVDGVSLWDRKGTCSAVARSGVVAGAEIRSVQ